MDEDSNSLSSIEAVAGKRKRESKRKAELNLVKDKWTTREKRALLAAVKSLGVNDTKKLAEHLSEKNKGRINSYLRSREYFGRTAIKEKKLNESETAIEKWFGAVRLMTMDQEDFSRMIGEALSAVADDEETVEVANESQEVRNHDLFELHKYLKSLLCQEITPVLSVPNQKVLSYLIDMLWRIVEGVAPNLQNEIEFLTTSTQQLLSKKRSKNGCIHKDSNVNDGLQSSLNPLSIPREILEKISNELFTNPAYIREVEAFVHTCYSN